MSKRLEKLKPENIQANTMAWFRERIDLGPLLDFAAKKTVPSHGLSWIYLLGGAALFLFGLQVVTGALLLLYYQPTEASAFESVQRIMTDIPYGWLIRGMHVWGAHLFIGVVCLHFLTVLFTKAYRKPRELTWLCGMVMLFMALTFGFSGYLLPWNELSYYATRVGTNLPESVPVVGDFIVWSLRGGGEVTGDTISRFFAAHVVILPLVFGAFLGVHLLLIQFQGMSLPLGMTEKNVRDHRPFFTEFALADACLWLLLLGAIVTLAVFLPAEVGVKPTLDESTPEGIKPEWYFLFMLKTLKHVDKTFGVAMFGLGALFLLLVPFLDRNASRERKSTVFTAVFLLLVAYAAVFEVLAIVDPGRDHSTEHVTAATFTHTVSIDTEYYVDEPHQAQPPDGTFEAGMKVRLLEQAGDHSLVESAVGVKAYVAAENLKKSYHAARNVVSLILLWSVIGFMIFYLRRLLKENARVRKLYEGGEW